MGPVQPFSMSGLKRIRGAQIECTSRRTYFLHVSLEEGGAVTTATTAVWRARRGGWGWRWWRGWSCFWLHQSCWRLWLRDKRERQQRWVIPSKSQTPFFKHTYQNRLNQDLTTPNNFLGRAMLVHKLKIHVTHWCISWRFRSHTAPFVWLQVSVVSLRRSAVT